jgi:PAS domain S-box-containing protein
MRDFLLESLPEAILQLDNFGSITYSNPAAQALTGYRESQLLGKSSQFLTLDQEDMFKSTYELRSASSKGKMVGQGWNLRSDGERYWAETTIAALYSNLDRDQKQQIGFVCVIRDISEQRECEVSLRQNEERYRLLVEGIRDYSIYMLDIEGNIITWNQGGQQLTGYSSAEIIGKHFSIFYSSHDLLNNKPAVELETATKTGKYEEEGWRVKKNGAVFWAGITLTAVYNEVNVLIGFSKVTKDLTEQNIEKAALRQSEERYRLLVEQVVDYGIFMMDEKGRIASWNEGAKRIKGYQASEVIGKYFSIFYPPDEIYNGKPTYELKIARQQGKYEEEGWRIRKDGTRFWANVIITAVYNAERNLVGFSKVTRDLTERQRAVQAERENAEKDRQFAREMETVNRMLSRTNNDLEQFTSIVSHDLQEPLRTVKSFLLLISQKVEKGQSEDIRTYVAKSISAANRMKELIQNVLDYSQVSKSQINSGNWPFEAILEDVRLNLKDALDESGAMIVSGKFDPDTITGDKIQLMQLFQNLISNAIKFTDGKRPLIKITQVSEGGHFRYSVSDNGIGMDADSGQKIFDPFRRLHNARNYPGAGMGLAICKRIVERHHGRIWVESQPGAGSTFHFTLWETVLKPTTSYETV